MRRVIGILGAVLLAAGCQPRLLSPLATLIEGTSVGFVTQHAIQFRNSSLTFTPTSCRSGGSNYSVIASSRTGWYKIAGLGSNSTYEFECTNGKERINFTARTFNSVEIIAPASGFVYQGVSYIPADTCFGHMRMVKYNEGNGKLMVWGQATKACYGEYDGTTWTIIPMSTPDATSLVYQVGSGLRSLSNGTVYASNTTAIAADWTVRIYRCTSDCTRQASWEVGSLPILGTNAGGNISISPDNQKMVYTNSLHSPSIWGFCNIADDCLLNTSWTIYSHGATDANKQSYSYVDSQGNLWAFYMNRFNPLWYCSAANFQSGACTTGAGWTAGKMVAGADGAYANSEPLMFEENGYLTIFAADEYSSHMVAGRCLLSSGTCGVVGGGVFTNFSGSQQTAPGAFQNAFSNAYFHKTNNGYASHFRSTDGNKVKYHRCVGDFTTCSVYNTTNWTAVSILPDGLDHVWDQYFERNSFTDEDGEPAAFLTQWATYPLALYYF